MPGLIARSAQPVDFFPEDVLTTLALAVFDTTDESTLDLGQPTRNDDESWLLAVAAPALPGTLYRHRLRFEWTMDAGLPTESVITEFYDVVLDESELLATADGSDIAGNLDDLVVPPTLAEMRIKAYFLADYQAGETFPVPRVNELVNDGLYRASLAQAGNTLAQRPLRLETDRPSTTALVCQAAVAYAAWQLRIKDDEYASVDRLKAQYEAIITELSEFPAGVY